jgi:hypothetical protein
MKYFIITLLLSFSAVVVSKSPINYDNKNILVVIENRLHSKSIQLQELFLSDKPAVGKYFAVLAPDMRGYLYIGRSKTMFARYFDYFIMYDNSAKVSFVRVTNYHSPKGRSICSSEWLNQFVGYNGRRELGVGEEVDILTGATVSAHAMTSRIVARTKTLRQSLLTAKRD